MKPVVTDHALINGNRIAYGVHGRGEPVVLLHGTPSSSLIWRDVLPVLTGAGYRAYVFDLLGYGLSERPWDPAVDTSMTGQVPVLEGLLDHWRLETVHLVAHDIGAAIAQRLGVFSPGRLRSLTMIDAVCFDSSPSKRTREQMASGLETMLTASDGDHRTHFREWLLSAVRDRQRLTEGPLDTYLGYISGPIGQGSLIQHQMRHYDPKHTMEIADRLHELGTLPVKLIWGADDAWLTVDWAHRLNAAIPGSELSVVDDCGHFAMEDRPEEIGRLVREFLDRNG